MTIDIEVSDQLDDAGWDDFVARHRFSQHEQTSGFARSRIQIYKIFRIILREKSEIIGGSQIFVLPTRLGNTAEIRHGPIFREDNIDLVREFVHTLKKEAAKRKLVKINVFSMGGYSFIEKALLNLNFQSNEFHNSVGSTVLVDLISTEEEIFSRIKRKTRYNIRYAEKKGITVEKGDRTSIKKFYDIYKQTSELKNFSIFPIDYFYHLWDLYSKNGRIYLLVASSNDTPLATVILAPFNKRLCRLWFAALRVKPDPKAGYLLDWETILMAKKLGYHEFDFCGTDQGGVPGYSEYKRNFGGIDHQYPDSLEYYFGMFPNLKRKLINILWRIKIVRKLTNRYVYGNQARLPF